MVSVLCGLLTNLPAPKWGYMDGTARPIRSNVCLQNDTWEMLYHCGESRRQALARNTGKWHPWSSITGRRWGEITQTCLLSISPLTLLTLFHGGILTKPSWHPSIMYQHCETWRSPMILWGDVFYTQSASFHNYASTLKKQWFTQIEVSIIAPKNRKEGKTQ